jgi:predicted aspartyl protease
MISDGVIGLGINYQNEKESLLMKMVNQGYIKHQVFSFYLSDSSRDSVLYFDDQSTNPNFGGIYKRMNYCEVVNKSAESWECDLSSLSIGSGENSNFTINRKVIFETGTSYIIVPRKDYDQIKHSIIGNSVCMLSNFNQLVCKCKSHNSFSNLNLNLNNGSLFLETNTFIEFEPYQEYQCKFQLLVDDKIENWLLGDAALRGLYITFDYQRKRIGYAKNYFLEESTAEVKDEDDVKIYYFVALILIGVAMFGLFRWANTQYERKTIEKRDVFIDKMINLQEK